MINRILLAADASDNALRAVDYVIGLCDELRAQHPIDIHLLNVQRPLTGDVGTFVAKEALRDYHHEPILASMGSLAHYMQELSHEGLGIHDFIHEGNLPYWQEDIEAPKGRVKWILIEEQAEGGDVLAQRARASSEFLSGFKRVCSGGGVALYEASN